MYRVVVGLAFAGTVLAGTLAAAQPPAAPRAAPARPPGYLKPEQLIDGTRLLTPPPKKGDPRDVADRAIFKSTRKLEGTPRWAMAVNDVKYDAQSLYDDFACSLGVRLTPQSAPRLTQMIGRLARDSSAAVNHAKDIFNHPRPYLSQKGNICVAKTDDLAKSMNYPSGHQGLVWSFGLALAQAAPDRATPILDRARAFGESRVVCGVHTASAVEASRTLIGGVMAVTQNNPEFRDDLAAARAEIETARKAGGAPDGGVCSAQQALLKTPW